MDPITPHSAKTRALRGAKGGRIDLGFRQFVLCLLTLDDSSMSLDDRKAFVTGALEDGDVELSDSVQAYLKSL